jgi:hypothetical protein
MRLHRRVSLLLIASLAITAGAQSAPAAGPADYVSPANGYVPPEATSGAFVVCAAGVSRGDCDLNRGRVQRALRELRLEAGFGGEPWRYVLMDESGWQQTLRQFSVGRNVPAFSALPIRTTYLNLALLSTDGRVDEALQPYGERRAILEHVLAHEAGHILCRTPNERIAENAAGRLRYGSARSLSCR